MPTLRARRTIRGSRAGRPTETSSTGSQFQRKMFNQLEAYRSGRFARIGHTLLVGGEYGRQTIDRLQYFGTTPSITLYNPVPDLAPTLSTTPTTNVRFWAQTA